MLFRSDYKQTTAYMLAKFVEVTSCKVCTSYTSLEQYLSLIHISSEPLQYAYDDEDSVETKISKVACTLYGASIITYSAAARKKLKHIVELGYEMCIRDRLCTCVNWLAWRVSSSISSIPVSYTHLPRWRHRSFGVA